VGKRRSGVDKNANLRKTYEQVNVLITDKTGTITEGKPSVEKVFRLKIKRKTCCKYCFVESV
jgi:cation transport ATPase